MDLTEGRFAGQVGPHCKSPKCKSARVIWCLTEGTKQMLVNADQVEYAAGHDFGSIRLSDTGGSMPRAVVVKPAERFGRQGTLHHSHFVTCPDSARFRRAGYQR